MRIIPHSMLNPKHIIPLAVLFWLPLSQNVSAEECTPQQFAQVMDTTGARITAMSVKNGREITAKTARLNASRKNKTAGRQGLSLSNPSQLKLNNYNKHIDELMGRMDRLGDLTLDPTTDCRRLTDLKANSATLLQALRQRFQLLDAEFDAQLAQINKPKQPSKPAAKTPRKPTAKAPAKRVARKTRPLAASQPRRPALSQPRQPALSQPRQPALSQPRQPAPWKTTTTTQPPVGDIAAFNQRNGLPPPLIQQQPAPPVDERFTVAEIKAAGRGFFGTISTSLANGINYTFQKIGRPTGYILGREGGGAFIAGLRYGKGYVIMKRFDRKKVYWRGPSLGYDAGAEGSRTMFLIYNLRAPNELFRRFSGADGAAYLGGGVGITILTNGRIVMAPIRSGIGLRLGASVGYLKFSPKQGWNPF